MRKNDLKKINDWMRSSGGVPRWHIVLGSGFGSSLDVVDSDVWEKKQSLSFSELETLSSATAPDHPGMFHLYSHREKNISAIFQAGRLHGYEGLTASSVVQTVMLTRLAGVKEYILTNAAGGLCSKFKAGDVMMITDHVNLTGQNPLLGKNPADDGGKFLGPRFPDLQNLYDPKKRKVLKESLSAQKINVHEGIYLGVLGPSFETPAEVALFCRWGMDAVGMSTVWEAIALKHSGATVNGLSLISNMASGLTADILTHEAIVETSKNTAARIVQGIFSYLESSVSSKHD